MSWEPFALQLYRRFLDGDTIAELALELGIPAERIEIRIRAAARYWQTRKGEEVKHDRYVA
jgi:hypothetical protein